MAPWSFNIELLYPVGLTKVNYRDVRFHTDLEQLP